MADTSAAAGSPLPVAGEAAGITRTASPVAVAEAPATSTETAAHTPAAVDDADAASAPAPQQTQTEAAAAAATPTPALAPKPLPKPATKPASKLEVPVGSSAMSAFSSRNRRKKRSAALIARAKVKPLPPTPSASTSASDAPAPPTAAAAGAAAGPAPQASIPLAAPIAAPLPAIDHLIHRCASLDDLATAIKTFRALGFTVLEGGQHADGLSRNALIVFADGTYLEFIAFEDEPTSPDGTPIRRQHGRTASAGHGPASWFSTFRRERRPSSASASSSIAPSPAPPPAAIDAAAAAASATSVSANQWGSRPTDESKDDFLARRAKHWWWDTPPKGWIDFCFTTGVAPVNQKREFIAEAKRGGPHRTPSLHRTAIVNANAASATAKAKRAALHAPSGLDSKPQPAIPRPMPEAALPGGTVSGASAAGGSLGPAAGSRIAAEVEELPPVAYDPPFQLGRRTKAEGHDLKFEVIFPQTARRRVPFFCEDISPRTLRVPPAASRHPNGSTGLSAITLLYASSASFQQALSVLCPLLGVNTLSKVIQTHPAISSTTFDLRIRTPSSLSPPSSSTAADGSASGRPKTAEESPTKPISPSIANIGRRGSGAGRRMSVEGEVGDTSQESAVSSASQQQQNAASPAGAAPAPPSNPAPTTSAAPAPAPAANSPPSHTIPIHCRIAQDVQERAHVERYGEGLYEVEIFAAADRLPASAPPDGLERTTAELGYGRVRLHPIFVSMLPLEAQIGMGLAPALAGAAGVEGPRRASGGSGMLPVTMGPLKQSTV